VIDILHHGMPNLSITEIQHKLKRIYGVKDLQTIFVYDFRTEGARRYTGFGLIFDSLALVQIYESNHKLAQNGIQTHIGKTKRKCKQRAKKISGMKKFVKNKQVDS
jgi:small subunit ribosomal protein S24e